MKEFRRHVVVIRLILLLVFIGMGIRLFDTVYSQGSRWLASKHNTRLSVAKEQVVMGSITDCNGVTLAYDDALGIRCYSENNAIRYATAQTVGDVSSFSGTGVQTFHAGTLLGFSGSIIDRTWELYKGKSKQGDNIQLTVNADLCADIAGAFPYGVKGAVTLINYKTGEILAMVSMPTYDPANLSLPVEDTAYMNKCLQGLYTPGSVFKLVTLTSALENLTGVLSEVYTCEGTKQFGSGNVTCMSGNEHHGTLTLREALTRSCNISFAQIGYELGSENLVKTAKTLGFNDNFIFADIKLYNSEIQTDINNVYDLAWTAVGQGKTLVTPMHMALIVSAIANDGVMPSPKLIKQVTGSTGIQRPHKSDGAYGTVMSSGTASIIKEYMRDVVEYGTGTRAQVNGYRVCGKTGSAEVSDDKNVNTNAWFVGFIDDERMPYAVSVVLEGAGSGGYHAAELASNALYYATTY